MAAWMATWWYRTAILRIGGRRAANAVLGAAKQLHRMDVRQTEIERRAEAMERVRDVWDDELEV